MTKTFKLLLLTTLFLTLASFAYAEEPTLTDEPTLETPKILPDHPLYFLKTGWERVQEVLTFNQERKLELQQRFSTEKLAELEGLTRKQAKQEIIEKTRLKYAERAERVRVRIQELTGEDRENPRINAFIEKYQHQEQIHLMVLEKLEDRVPEAVKEKIQEQRLEHLERYETIKSKLEQQGVSPEEARQQVEDKLDQVADKPATQKIKARALEKVQTNFKALKLKLRPDSITPSLDSSE